MVSGIGIDLADVERVQQYISKQKGFAELTFSPKEVAYCEANKNKFEHYAARFAAKEAFLKALGSGWCEGTDFNEIEIINDEKGQPQINLLGNTQKTIASLGVNKILVSLSHLKSIAAAVVIIEK